MVYRNEFRGRKILRLKGHNYSWNAAYFITLCVNGRLQLFGDVVDKCMKLNPSGEMIKQTWCNIGRMDGGVRIGHYHVMPNHFHGIIIIDGAFSHNPVFLGDIVRRFKTMTTHLYSQGVRKLGWNSFERRLWQRGYHDSRSYRLVQSGRDGTCRRG